MQKREKNNSHDLIKVKMFLGSVRLFPGPNVCCFLLFMVGYSVSLSDVQMLAERHLTYNAWIEGSRPGHCQAPLCTSLWQATYTPVTLVTKR